MQPAPDGQMRPGDGHKSTALYRRAEDRSTSFLRLPLRILLHFLHSEPRRNADTRTRVCEEVSCAPQNMPASLQIRSNWPERSSMSHADIRALARRWFPSPRGRDATAFVRTGCWLGPRGATSPMPTRAQLRTLHIPGRCDRQRLPRCRLSVKILPVLRSFFLQKENGGSPKAAAVDFSLFLLFHFCR